MELSRKKLSLAEFRFMLLSISLIVSVFVAWGNKVMIFCVKRFLRFLILFGIAFIGSSIAGHKMHDNDLELDVDNAEVVAEGKYWFGYEVRLLSWR